MNDCYVDWAPGGVRKDVSSFTLIKGDDGGLYSDPIYTNVCYSNDYTWTNGKATLTIQTDGNLVCKLNDSIIWSTNTQGNTNARLCALRTGELVIFDTSGKIIWDYHSIDSNNSLYAINNTNRYRLGPNGTLEVMNNNWNSIYGDLTNRLYSKLFYQNGFTISSSNNKFKLQMKSNGALFAYPSTNINNILWDSLTGTNDQARLLQQPDGNLRLLRTDGTEITNYGVNGNGAYCELTNFGLILIKSTNNSIIKCLNILTNDTVSKHRSLTIRSERYFEQGMEKCFSDQTIIYPELIYTKDFIWRNGEYTLKMQVDGNLVTYGPNGSIGSTKSNIGETNMYLLVGTDGKPMLYKSNGDVVSNDRDGRNINPIDENLAYSNFKYLKLTNTGYVLYLNTNDKIVNISSRLTDNLNSELTKLRQNIKNAAKDWYLSGDNFYNDSKEGIPALKTNIKNYLKDSHWNNSPDMMFSRKSGQFFELDFRNNTIKTNVNLVNGQYIFVTSGGNHKYDTISAGFRGWYVVPSNGVWNTNRKNLQSSNGYNTNYNPTEGPNADSTSGNYSDSSEWKNWEGDKKMVRIANELKDWSEKPNYVPGYVRISGNHPDFTKTSQNNLGNISADTWFSAGGFLISDRCGTCTNAAFPIYLKIRNTDTYANDIWDNNPRLIRNIISDKISVIFDTNGLFHTPLVNDRLNNFMTTIGFNNWGWVDDPWKNRIIENVAIRSAFTNKSLENFRNPQNFLYKINKALPYDTKGTLIENFENSSVINPLCNLSNILKDPNCSGKEYDLYKQYLTTMDDYCIKNPLKPVCTTYITKEIVNKENPAEIYKINEENKIKILTKQETSCSDTTNYLDPRCITINSKKPEIIQQQILQYSPDSQIYKQLASNYGDEITFQTCSIEDNIIKTYKNICDDLEQKSTIYAPKIKNKRLEVCRKDANLFSKECIDLNNREQFKSLKDYCIQDKNITQKECVELNKIHQLNDVKNNCKENKTDNCKQLCKEYNEEFKDICFWENNQLYFILGFVVLILIGGAIGYFKLRSKKQSIPQSQNEQQPVYDQQLVYDQQPVYNQQPVFYS